MFISDQHNFVFFEVPRTGSNSVSAALAQFDPQSPTVAKRNTINVTADYHAFAMPQDGDSNESRPILFAGHRNPYARIWSFWKHRHRHGNPAVFRTTTWERYVDWACDPDSVPEIQEAMLDIPISEMFDCDRVDFWLCYETLEQSWRQFGQAYDLNLPALGISHASTNLGLFQQAYDAKIAAKVADRYAADFERFGYDIDSWRLV